MSITWAYPTVQAPERRQDVPPAQGRIFGLLTVAVLLVVAMSALLLVS